MNKAAMIVGGVVVGIAMERAWKELDKRDDPKIDAIKDRVNRVVAIITKYEDVDLNRPFVFVRKIIGGSSAIRSPIKQRLAFESTPCVVSHLKRLGEKAMIASFFDQSGNSEDDRFDIALARYYAWNEGQISDAKDLEKTRLLGSIINEDIDVKSEARELVVTPNWSILFRIDHYQEGSKLSDFVSPTTQSGFNATPVLLICKNPRQEAILKELWIKAEAYICFATKKVRDLNDSPVEACVPVARPMAPARYDGSAICHQDFWLEMIKKRRKHHVILYGKPGCGKSTLVKDFIWRHKLTAIYIESKNVRTEIWRATHSHADLIVIEDVERLTAPEDIATLLAALEHTPQASLWDWEPPLIIMTANDPSKLPEAVGRCGRMDQIIHVESNDVEDHQAQMRSLAERVGLNPDELESRHVDEVMRILSKYTPAYAEQYLVRLAAYGQKYKLLPGDVTFDVPFAWKEV